MSHARLREIGPYRIEARLGRGGMGEVWRAWDERLERSVAVKLIRPESAGDATARERLRREARAAAALTHPAVARIYDLVETGEGDAIVMELVEGEPLAARLGRGPLAIDEAVRFGRQIASALAAAHARGILHRDLKPENVIVTPEGQAKVLDFGLAARLDRSTEASLTRAGGVVGTFRAMSPEQARGLPLDARSDLFALGILLYEMLTGRSPFLAATAMDTLQRVCTWRQEPARELRPEVPEELSHLADHLLEKEPGLRPRSAAEVERALGPLLGTGAEPPAPGGGETTWAPPARGHAGPAPAVEPLPGPSSPPSRSASGARRARLLAAVVPVLALAGLAAWLLRVERPPLQVAVLPPALAGTGNDAAALAAAGVRLAALRGLLSLRGVSPIAPEQVDAVAGPPRDVARATAADEVLTSRLSCNASVCQVSLGRVGGKDGAVLWAGGFEVPVGEPFLLAEVVESRVRKAYPGHAVRAGIAPLAVRPADYVGYLAVRRAVENPGAGALTPDEAIARLEAVRRTSPRFVDAAVLEAYLRKARFQDRRDAADLERAAAVLARASAVAPEDPRPWAARVEVELRAERLDEAERALAKLEELQPGDPGVLVYRAQLRERQGAGPEALALLRRAVAARPSWNHLLRLARMEYRLGEIEAARGHLEELLARSPGAIEGKTLLAQIELWSGRPERAAALYEELVARSPRATELTNLGVAYMLLGRYREAEARLREVVSGEPANPFSLLNLADVLLLSGKTAEARGLYRRIVELVEKDPAAANWQLQTTRAQALAHLGRKDDAVKAVQEVLPAARDNAQAMYEASLVYTLAGDLASARVSVGKALALGAEPRWFAFPWFDPLRGRGGLDELLRRPVARR